MSFEPPCFGGFKCAAGASTVSIALENSPDLHLEALGGVYSLKTRTKGCTGHLNLNQSPFMCYPTLICTNLFMSMCLSKALSTSL
jgi:hypothetical protein